MEEIEMALQWSRPSILLAVHNSIIGRVETQHFLERELSKKNKKVTYVNIDGAHPDIIRIMCETPNSENTVFFISGIENANRASEGKVYRALNISRELLVEKSICVVFWLNESEAANLSRLAPDFWAFRYRFVEFASKRGTKNQSIPIGLFLWKEHIPWMKADSQKNKLAYYEDFLIQIPKEESAAAVRIETILQLAHISWLLNDLKKFTGYLKDGIDFLEKHPNSHYQSWILNAQGIKLYEEGSKKNADILFAEALRHDPDNSITLLNISIAAHGLGKNRNAILLAKRAIKKSSNNFYYWHVLGCLFLSMGKIEDAIEALTIAQNINADNADIHYSLAICYYKNGQPAECAKELLKAEKKSTPHNELQGACVEILSDKTGEVRARIKSSLEKELSGKHHILRDPNLHFLLNTQEPMATH